MEEEASDSVREGEGVTDYWGNAGGEEGARVVGAKHEKAGDKKDDTKQKDEARDIRKVARWVMKERRASPMAGITATGLSFSFSVVTGEQDWLEPDINPRRCDDTTFGAFGQ